MCFGSKKKAPAPAPAPTPAAAPNPAAAPADNGDDQRKRITAANTISTTQGEFGSELGASSTTTP